MEGIQGAAAAARNPSAGRRVPPSPACRDAADAAQVASITLRRTTRVAIIGHSLGAFAVSYVQGVDKRVETVVALDKLTSKSQPGIADLPPFKPVVPARSVVSTSTDVMASASSTRGCPDASA